ncbi:hypothetical protein JCM11491_003774 [Sporobolomyces phaffii]
MSSEDPTPEPQPAATDHIPPKDIPDESSTKLAESPREASADGGEPEDTVQGPTEGAVGTTAQDAGDWQAVFSPEANAWYFWNSKTNETTWSNPREAASSSSAAVEPPPVIGAASSPAEDPASASSLPPIDPELAWLDPSASRGGGVGATGSQAARFNARTGRFQVDQKLTPDRISDYQRGHRQQEAYYDVKGWEQQLEGKGIKRAGEETDEDGARKRPSAKQVEKFKQQKQEKKKKKLTSWLAT